MRRRGGEIRRGLDDNATRYDRIYDCVERELRNRNVAAAVRKSEANPCDARVVQLLGAGLILDHWLAYGDSPPRRGQEFSTDLQGFAERIASQAMRTTKSCGS